MKAGYIYYLTDKVGGSPKYVGQSTSPKKRLQRHIRDAKISSSPKIRAWIRSLLHAPIMEILEYVEDVSFWEQHYISLFKSFGFVLYNSTEGGEAPPRLMGDKNPMKRSEVKEKISKAMRIRTVSVETRKKMSQSKRDLKVIPPTRRGTQRSEKDIEKMIATRLKNGIGRKPVSQFTENGVFLRMWGYGAEIKREYPSFSIGNIHAVCNGKRKYAYGFIWSFENFKPIA